MICLLFGREKNCLDEEITLQIGPYWTANIIKMTSCIIDFCFYLQEF